MPATSDDICHQIRTERSVGLIRCGLIERPITILEIARLFGLIEDTEVYHLVEREHAEAIARHVLSTGLAHGSDIMSADRATELWRRFLKLFGDQPVQFFANCPAGLDAWWPATNATIDLGVLVVGETKAGCIWAEEED